MIRLAALLLLTLVVLAAGSAPVSSAQIPIPPVTLSGGDLPHEVALAPADADAFRRRVNQPPRLDETPAAGGASYVVTTPYWDEAVRREDDEEDAEVADEADYFPEGGFVCASLDGENVWMVIDLRQRAILDRYIRLTLEGSIDERPSTLEVIAASDESFGMHAGATPVGPEDARTIVEAAVAASSNPFVEPPEPPQATPASRAGLWLTLTLVEGRALQYYYDGAFITESLGTERYDVGDAAGLLDSLATAALPEIEQEKPAGSMLWWPAMLGGGLAAIGLAVWLRRRQGGPL